jgi:uncharacterized protein YdhG (YjbR/CyaY superfamily)
MHQVIKEGIYYYIDASALGGDMTIEGLLALLAGPARRALRELKLKRLEDLSGYTMPEIKSLHGIGPNAMKIIVHAMEVDGIQFKKDKTSLASSHPIETIDQYIEQFPPDIRLLLEEMRTIIKEAAPGAMEKISYKMPTFHLNGNLVYFAAFKEHIGLYPLPHAIQAFEKELKNYKVGKGSIRFPMDRPLPKDLIARIVKSRIADNLAKRNDSSGRPGAAKAPA